MIKFAVLAVAVTVAGPTYSGSVEDGQVDRLAQREKTSKDVALGTLIRRHWVEGEAKERGIVETETDAALRTALLTAAIRDQITEPAAKSVTPDQVKAYVDANPLSAPEQRTVRVVATKNRTQAIKVLRKLRRGATFSDVGGTTDTYDRADETAPGRAIFRAKLNRLTRYGRIVFKVIRHTPAKPLPRAQQEAMAWEVLASEAQQRALDEFMVRFTAKWRERTTCAPRYGRHEDCGQPPSGQQAP